jgi:hypothetical protein
VPSLPLKLDKYIKKQPEAAVLRPRYGPFPFQHHDIYWLKLKEKITLELNN